MEISYTPTLDSAETARRLERLLVPGALRDPALLRSIDRLAEDFRSYAGAYPLPLWAPGLVLTPEMRSLTEALFPLKRVSAVFERVLRRGCRFAPLLEGTYLRGSASWLDLLQRFRPQLPRANPAAILAQLAEDQEQRTRFLFALLLPHHFGGSFDRYPEQSRWLAGWLQDNAGRLAGRVRALDSACGSGEGTYGLAEQIAAAGYRGAGCRVHGSTLELIELFAGAHAFFPHDPERQMVYRNRVAPLLAGKETMELKFYLDDLGTTHGGEKYDVILCNGLLGGPLMHEPAQLSAAMEALASRLLPGGVLLAADRFHAGWRQQVAPEELRALLRESGLTPLEIGEGVAGRR